MASLIEWVNQPISGNAIAHVAYVWGIPYAAIDYWPVTKLDDSTPVSGEPVPVYAVFLRTNQKQPSCIAYTLDDARLFVERSLVASSPRVTQ